jgi:hypothetical protein
MLEYVPDGHCVQNVEPTAELKVPIIHFEQEYGPPVIFLTSISIKEKDPGIHDRQAIWDVI